MIPHNPDPPPVPLPTQWIQIARWHDLGRTGYAVPCPGRECPTCRSIALSAIGRLVEKRRAS